MIFRSFCDIFDCHDKVLILVFLGFYITQKKVRISQSRSVVIRSDQRNLKKHEKNSKTHEESRKLISFKVRLFCSKLNPSRVPPQFFKPFL